MARKRIRKIDGETLCSAFDNGLTPFDWDQRWGAPLEAVAVQGLNYSGNINEPPSKDVFRQSRRIYRTQRFVRRIQALRAAFYNHGLLGVQTRLKDPKKPDTSEVLVSHHPGILALNPKDAEKLEAWKRAQYKAISQYVTTAWQEFLMVDNLICLWRNGANSRALIQLPERCDYRDQFGGEILIIRHELSHAQIDAMNIGKAEKDRLKASKELKLTPTDELYRFDVVKREPVGMGLGWPAMATIFHAAAIVENLEVSDRQLSDAMRTIYEQHLVGHEIKSGPHAGSNAHFIKPARATAVNKAIKAKKGHIQLVTNFDHQIKFGAGLPDPKQFDGRRFEGVLGQLAHWGLPLAQMLTGTVNPFLMTLLRQQAEAERELLRPHFMRVLAEALKCPVDIRLQWDSTIFWDSRLMLDLLKTALNAGPLSQETFLRSTGFDHAAELPRKQVESALPMELKAPAWDPHHGKRPGDDKGGKPPGKNDLS
jgi:hypothetical protein